MTTSASSFADRLAQLGRGPAHDGRLVNLPIDQGSTMLFETMAAFEAARDARYEPGTLYYGRYGTEGSLALEESMAVLEGAAGCIALSSGVMAVSMALMGAAKAGDHVLVADHVYGNTRGFCERMLTRFGVEVEFFDPMLGSNLAGLMRANTSVVLFEAPGSGTFEVPDIPAIAQVARAHGAVSILDGTWATPLFCQPLSLGVDVVVHSGSKYLSGHSDSMLGIIACNEATHAEMRKTVLTFGERPGSLDVFLSLRGLRTLEMRLKHAEAQAMAIAGWLKEQRQVLKILHPAFPDCPGHAFWKRDFTGATGLFAVVFKPCSDAQVRTFVDALRCFGIGASWGGFESLVLPVKPQRTAAVWNEPGQVIRFSIGNESRESLIADLSRALPLLD